MVEEVARGLHAVRRLFVHVILDNNREPQHHGPRAEKQEAGARRREEGLVGHIDCSFYFPNSFFVDLTIATAEVLESLARHGSERRLGREVRLRKGSTAGVSVVIVIVERCEVGQQIF